MSHYLSLSDLNDFPELQKEIIANVIANTKQLLMDKSSNELLGFLEGSSSLEDKVAAIEQYSIEQYMRDRWWGKESITIEHDIEDAIQQAKKSYFEPIYFGAFNRADFQYATEKSKAEIIENICDDMDLSDFSWEQLTPASSNVLAILKADRSTSEKWQALLSYGKDVSNSDQYLYRCAKDLIERRVSNYTFHINYVKEYNELRLATIESDSDVTREMLKEWNNNTVKVLELSPISSREKSELLFNQYALFAVLHSKQEEYRPALKCCEAAEKVACSEDQKDVLKNIRHALKNQSGNMVVTSNEKCVGRYVHKLAFFGGALAKDTGIGIAIPLAVGVAFVKELPLIGFPIFVAGIALAVPGLAVGFAIGIAHGLLRAATRNTLTIAQQDKLDHNLKKCDQINDVDKNRIIINIVQKYNETKSIFAQSKSSVELMETLVKGNLSVDEKWAEMKRYMSAPLAGDVLKNNGKRLFCIIDKELENYVSNTNKKSLMIS